MRHRRTLPGPRPRSRALTGRAAAIGTLVLAAAVLPAAISSGTPLQRGAEGRAAAPAAPSLGALRPAAPAARVAPARKPKENPRHGLVYRGLTPAASGSCLGEYQTASGRICTHGPDAPPAGMDVAAPVRPAVTTGAAKPVSGAVRTDAQLAAEAAPADAAAPGTSATAVPCEGDGTSGNRVQVLYVHADAGRYDEYLGSFRAWAAGIDQIYNAGAQQTGGERHIRYVTEKVGSECRAVVTKVQVAASDLSDFGATIRAVGAKGFNRQDRKYVMYVDSKVYCGIGGFAGDDRPGAQNRSNFGPSYGRTDSGCWGAGAAAHELGHNLGAVNNSAPNSSHAGHCVDDEDLMCYKDTPTTVLVVRCPNVDPNTVDCNHDDYYSTNPKPGSYLASHWNVADDAFLIKGGGGGGGGTPDPSDTTPPSVPSGLKTADITATGLTLTWTASRDNVKVSEYEVRRDGQPIGTGTTPSFTVTGLAAEVEYRFTVVAKDAAGNASAASEPLTVKTAAGSGGGGTGPKVGVPYTITNGLTGRVADVFRGHTTAGTAVVQYPAHGGNNQQWTFADAGGGSYSIKSVSSGLCLDLTGDNRGLTVQNPCSAQARTQHWTVRTTDAGVQLSPQSAPAQLLGLSDWMIDGSRLLGLRTPSAQVARSTVWTLTTE